MADNELYHVGVKGMKWGVRRYQNKDGSLTPAGKKRYGRDVQENNAKKKDNRIVIDGPDAKRWAREDLSRTKDAVDASSDMVRQLKKIDESTRSRSKQTMDLSKMSDQELRDRINRANLEKQYNDIFGSNTVSRGRERASAILDGAGTALTLTGSALTIALAVKKLMG